MSIRGLAAALLLGACVAAGCGGDNLSLCDGCEAPTATVTVTPAATSTGATPTSTTTPSPLRS